MSDEPAEVHQAYCVRCGWVTPKLLSYEVCEFKLVQHLEREHGVIAERIISEGDDDV